jgi:hypothetical protein
MGADFFGNESADGEVFIVFPGQTGTRLVGIGRGNCRLGGKGFGRLHHRILAKRRKKGEKGSEAETLIPEGYVGRLQLRLRLRNYPPPSD